MNAWIGSTIGIMPSGKVYTFWTSNQTDEDVNRDQCFNDALEEIAEEQGVYVDWRDGDLCLTKNTTWEEVAQASGYDLYVTAPYGDRYYWAAVENREDRSDEDFEEPQEAWKDCCITNNLVQS